MDDKSVKTPGPLDGGEKSVKSRDILSMKLRNRVLRCCKKIEIGLGLPCIISLTANTNWVALGVVYTVYRCLMAMSI